HLFTDRTRTVAGSLARARRRRCLRFGSDLRTVVEGRATHGSRATPRRLRLCTGALDDGGHAGDTGGRVCSPATAAWSRSRTRRSIATLEHRAVWGPSDSPSASRVSEGPRTLSVYLAPTAGDH